MKTLILLILLIPTFAKAEDVYPSIGECYATNSAGETIKGSVQYKLVRFDNEEKASQYAYITNGEIIKEKDKESWIVIHADGLDVPSKIQCHEYMKEE